MYQRGQLRPGVDATSREFNEGFSLNILQEGLLPHGEKSRTSRTMIIDSVDRHDAGTYFCEARNGVGQQKAIAAIQLQVLCKQNSNAVNLLFTALRWSYTI